MSVQAMSWAFKQDLPTAPKFVLVGIANSANDEGDNAFPGQRSLAKLCGMSVRSVRRHVEWLEAQGHLARIQRYRIDGSRTSDRYVLACSPIFPRFDPLPEGFCMGSDVSERLPDA